MVSAEPFHRTVSPETKLVPVTVRVKPELPAVALFGEIELTVGAGGIAVALKTGTLAFPPLTVTL